MSFLDKFSKSRSEKVPVITEVQIKQALSSVMDPDLNKDIVTLGFVQNVVIKGTEVSFKVVLTTPACPVKELLKKQCEQAVLAIPGIETANVEMTAVTKASPSAFSSQSETLSKVKNIIAVASGKGGVGKSTTAVQLAYALSKTGAKVGLLDADVYGPSLPLMTGVSDPTQQRDGIVIPPVANGVKIISTAMFSSGQGAAILRGPMAANVIKQFVTKVEWGELDYLLIDYPPGTGDIQLTLSQITSITGAVIVTTPQEMALIDVRKAVHMFQTLKVPVLGVIETMSYFICDGCDKKHFLFHQGGGQKLATQYGVPLLGQIPMDTHVVQSSDQGQPEILSNPDGQASLAYTLACGELARHISILNAGAGEKLQQFSIDWQN